MKENISNIWLQFLCENLIVLSWGISQISQTNGSLRFKVNGNNYKGFVLIEFHGEKYDIFFENTDTRIRKISIDDITMTIDKFVEQS